MKTSIIVILAKMDTILLFFSTNGVSYQHVCGRARGYQKGSTDAFRDSYYVDGLSITHGS